MLFYRQIEQLYPFSLKSKNKKKIKENRIAVTRIHQPTNDCDIWTDGQTDMTNL